MKKVIIYIRVSNPKQTIYGLSLEDQEYRLLQYCKSREWEVVEIIHEVKNAKTFKRRPKINSIVKEMRGKSKRFDAILCTSFDRFSRDVSSAEEVMYVLKIANVELYTLEKKYNLNTVSGEREYIADAYRSMDDNLARAAKAQAGVKQRIRMGFAPFRVGKGYKNISGNKHKNPEKRTESLVVVDENTVHIFSEGFNLVATGNYSGEAARKYLNTKYGLSIRKQTFYSILRNPFYMGKLYYKNDEGQISYVEGKHPAIVSEATWYLVQEKLDGRKRNVLEYKKQNPDYPLKGYLSCPNCGKRMTAGKSKSRTGAYHHYYNCQRKDGSHSFNLKVETAHDIFNHILTGLKFSPEIMKAYRAVLRSTFEVDDAERTNRIKEIERILNDELDKRMEYIELVVKKTISEQDYKIKIEQMDIKKVNLEDELLRLQSIEASYAKYIRIHNPMLQDFSTYYWHAPIEIQKSITDTIFVGDIILDKEKVISISINANFQLLLNKNLNDDEKGSDIQSCVD